ncbi:hypothetical protein SD81_037130 [Tolypothrix campylonemoides VB511288]|nr:hypothetical protein SD81_037130 [Tolypothrix campylonemoides VB511288]
MKKFSVGESGYPTADHRFCTVSFCTVSLHSWGNREKDNAPHNFALWYLILNLSLDSQYYKHKISVKMTSQGMTL